MQSLRVSGISLGRLEVTAFWVSEMVLWALPQTSEWEGGAPWLTVPLHHVVLPGALFVIAGHA